MMKLQNVVSCLSMPALFQTWLRHPRIRAIHLVLRTLLLQRQEFGPGDPYGLPTPNGSKRLDYLVRQAD